MAIDLIPDNLTEWANGGDITAPAPEKINQGWTGKTDDYAFNNIMNYLQNSTDKRVNSVASTINAFLQTGIPPHNALYHYPKDAVVTFNGAIYIAKAPNAGQVPPLEISNEYWEIVRGDKYLQEQLNLKANIDSPSLTGVPKTITPTDNTESQQIVNIEWATKEMDKRVRGTTTLDLTLKEATKAYPVLFAKNNRYTDTHITKPANDATGNMDLVIRGIGNGLNGLNTPYFEMINLTSAKDVNIKSFVKKVQTKDGNSEIVVWLKGGVKYTINQREDDGVYELIESTKTLNNNWVINVEEWSSLESVKDGSWRLDKQTNILIDYTSTSDIGSIETCGMIVAYPVETLPSGALICDGAEVSRTTYAKLFNKIGVRYGVGDGTSTFNLPDLRGLAIVGLDMGKGVDSNQLVTKSAGGEADRTQMSGLGSTQGDAIRDFNITMDGNSHQYLAYEDGGRWGQTAGKPSLSNSNIPTTSGSNARNQINNIALLWIIYYI